MTRGKNKSSVDDRIELRASEIESERVELRRCAQSLEEPSIKVAARAERPLRRIELAAGVLRGGSGGEGEDEEGGSTIINVWRMMASRSRRRMDIKSYRARRQRGRSSSCDSVEEFVIRIGQVCR